MELKQMGEEMSTRHRIALAMSKGAQSSHGGMGMRVPEEAVEAAYA